MRTKFYHIACFLLFIGILSYGQENRELDSQERALDSLNKNVKKTILLDKVKYSAKDCVYINRKDNKLILYNEAELYYQDIELRAGIIILDYKTNEEFSEK